MLKQLITSISLPTRLAGKTALSLALAMTLTNCAPQAPNRAGRPDPLQIGPTKVVAVDELIDYDLTPTYVPTPKKTKKVFQVKVDENGKEEHTKIEVERHFEKPTSVIKTKQAAIILDSLRMDKVAMKYNGVKRQLIITGQTEVLDKNKKIIGETPFTLVGEHSPLDMTFTLRAASPEKEISAVKPIVRAKVTCLAYNEQDQTNCSVVIVDFFVAYKMQIYSEQMEVSRPKSDDDTPNVKPDVKPEPTKDDDDVVLLDHPTQEEGEEEDSAPGRYVGQTENTDLKEIFDTEDDIQKVIKEDKDDEKDSDQSKIKDDDDKIITIKPVTPLKKKPGSTLDVDIKQTQSGDLRPVNQAIGYADNGNLRNATSLTVKQQALDENAFFEIVNLNSKRYFGTYEMAEMIARLGARINQQMAKKLIVTAVARQRGGEAKPSKSHQAGTDADMGYPTEDNVKTPNVVDRKSRAYNKRAFSVEKTYDVIKFAFKQPDIKVDRVFVDRIIISELCRYAKAKGEFSSKDTEVVKTMFQKLQHIDGHGDHFHLRLQCSPADPACKKMTYSINGSCS